GGAPGSAWRNAALAQVTRGAGLVEASAGDRLRLAGFTLDVLSPEPDQVDPGQLALRVRGPGGRSLCDLADLDADAQAVAAPRIAALGGCDYLLLPGPGVTAPVPEVLAAARPGRYLASDAGGRLPRDLPVASISRTSEEGTIVLPI
ncbi:MAG: hypothetical protein M3024_01105, partial [Candidatus Dormibacteraeota bacterium]|nr:hypothetical protein [Candidatus Dormibacteraeota bacterium]